MGPLSLPQDYTQRRGKLALRGHLRRSSTSKPSPKQVYVNL